MTSPNSVAITAIPQEAALDWGALLEQHRGWLATIIRSRLHETSAVDDVLQEVSLAVLRQGNRPRVVSEVPPWLYRIAVRKVINHQRQMGRRRRLLDGYTNQFDAENTKDSSPGEWLLKQEQASVIDKALQYLDAGDRQILMLKYTENWGYRDIAKCLGITEKTVEYRLLRARQTLRSVLTNNHESK